MKSYTDLGYGVPKVPFERRWTAHTETPVCGRSGWLLSLGFLCWSWLDSLLNICRADGSAGLAYLRWLGWWETLSRLLHISCVSACIMFITIPVVKANCKASPGLGMEKACISFRRSRKVNCKSAYMARERNRGRFSSPPLRASSNTLISSPSLSSSLLIFLECLLSTYCVPCTGYKAMNKIWFHLS